MIRSARPTVSPLENIVFALFCFASFLKVGTDGRKICAITMIPTGRDCGVAEWISKSRPQEYKVTHQAGEIASH